jgi:hypothetical protein
LVEALHDVYNSNPTISNSTRMGVKTRTKDREMPLPGVPAHSLFIHIEYHLYLLTMLELLIFSALMGLIVWCVVQSNRPPPQQDWRPPPQQRATAHHVVPGNAQQADLLAITITIKRAFQRGVGGVILINTSTQKALAIEFYGPAPRGDGIEVEFVQSPNVNRAKTFLRGEEQEMVRLPSSTFEALRTVLVRNSRSKNMTDVASGCLIYEGILP